MKTNLGFTAAARFHSRCKYIYSITFEEENEAEEALDNSPFFILNNLFSLQRWGSAKTCYEEYFIELPEEGEAGSGSKINKRLDHASESELILTWNHHLNLKRNRVAGVSLDDVEEELVKIKKMKKESWYDDEGKLVCVTVSTILGNHTFVVDEDGGLRPNTP